MNNKKEGNAKMNQGVLNTSTIKNLIIPEPPYELIECSDGSKIYVKALNKPSQEARDNLNKTFNELIAQGKI